MIRSASLASALVALLAFSSAALAAHSPDDPPLAVSVTDGAIVWTPTLAIDGLTIEISGPEGFVARRSYTAADVASLDLAALALPAGEYTYDATISGIDAAHETVVQSGTFVWADGAARVNEAVGVIWHTGAGGINGPLCIGYDCTTTEYFGSDDFKFKGGAIEVLFEDTDTGTTSSNDWSIQINEASSSGNNHFAIRDRTNFTYPLLIRAGAPTNSIYVREDGNVGIGMINPQVELHVKGDNTPALRLRQSNEAGWQPQTWDVAGNEANFFIRDASNGSTLPFRIQPGAPTNSIYIENSGEVGFGTNTPETTVDIVGTLHVSDDVVLDQSLDVDKDVIAGRDFLGDRFMELNSNYDTTDDIFLIVDRNTSGSTTDDEELFRVDGVGNVYFSGAVNPSSSVLLKEDFFPVDNASVLQAVRDLPLSTWRYRADAQGIRHLGPMAQDFYAAFGLGAGETSIATVDADGVALASIQALAAENDDLRQRNDALEARLARLERLVADLTSQPQGR